LTDVNIERFKNSLRDVRWNNVISSADTNESFDEFCNTFNDLYNLHFPLIYKKFNRNVRKVNNYMTAGLLVSRQNKNKIHKIAATNPSTDNVSKYTVYRNMYNKIIRMSKKHYFQS
jgi:hypothetical protein